MSKLNAHELPLNGVRILITRPEHQSKELASKLAALGAKPLTMPMIDIKPPDSWDTLDRSISNLDDYDWVMFASGNAVRFFFQRCQLKEASLDRQRIAVIGSSTERVAQTYGITADYKPTSFVAESFVQRFPHYPNLSGCKILWPRTDLGRDYIQDRLSKAGAKVDVVAAYKTCLPADAASLSEKLHALFAEDELDVITIASAQTAANLASILSLKEKTNDSDPVKSEDIRNNLKSVLKNVIVLSIGPETSAGAREHLGKLDLEADPHNSEGLVLALIEHFAAEKKQN